MFNVIIHLSPHDWHECDYEVEVNDMTKAYVSAIREVKRKLNMVAVDFIPLCGGQYIIWAQGVCQGYMKIKEVDEPPTDTNRDSE